MDVDVFLGDAKFTGPNTLVVDGQEIEFVRCVIATGGRAGSLPIPGLEQAGYLTNESIFSLTELPKTMIVIGTGPIGVEMAQAFRRFGSEVHLVNRGPRILSKEDAEAAAVVQQQLVSDGIQLHLNCNYLRVEVKDNAKHLTVETDGTQKTISADTILLAAGRVPNLEGLGLEAAGVKFNRRGIEIDDFLRSSNPRIYAAGDVAGSHQFTHAADAMARLCLRNALFRGRGRLSSLVVPRTTYTEPELAHVGLTPSEAAQAGIDIDSYRHDMSGVDRAILDGETEGFAVVHCVQGTGKVVGASVVGSHAGDLIGEISLLMTSKLPLSALGNTIHCYPTQVEVLKRIGDQFNRTKLTPFVASLFKKWLAWQRK
jgi:pyruvate/2-oxoglutarate dehydrogenase complex dihydrolipoamide dehydrogenase (E3) component